jgi:hypothetical protein
MNLRDKRGIELMGKTIIEIMVAIIVVVLLIYAGYVLFQTYFGSQKEEQASGQLGKVLETVAGMEIGEQKEMPLLAPKDWSLVSFDKDTIFVNDFEKPFIMHGNDCLCICKDKKCEICQATAKPFKMNGGTFSVKIPKDIILINYDEYYDLSLK